MIQVGREPDENRFETLAELEKLKLEEERLKKEMQKYRDSDPDYIADLKKETQVLFTFQFF